jgi:hypothetical protein
MYVVNGRNTALRRPDSAARCPYHQNLLHAEAANILFAGTPDCVLPDASGKFFAHF